MALGRRRLGTLEGGWKVVDTTTRITVDCGGNYGLSHPTLSLEARATHEALKWEATIGRKEELILTYSTQLVNELYLKTINNIPMVWTIASIRRVA